MSDQQTTTTQPPVVIRQGVNGLGSVIAALILSAAAVYAINVWSTTKKETSPAKSIEQGIEPQRGIVDHHHHAGVTIKEGLERRGCRDEGIGKGLIRPLLSQWLQLLQSCEQILLCLLYTSPSPRD